VSAHEQYADELALLAIGTLPEAERAALEEHLESCSQCRNELEQLRADAALLALSVEERQPPARARRRFLSAVTREPRMRAIRGRRPWWVWQPAMAAVILVLAAALFWQQNRKLRTELATVQQQMAHAQEMVEAFTSPEAVHVSLGPSPSTRNPEGKAHYLPKKGALVFTASNLAPLPPQKTYELWLVPATGRPVRAGVFKPDASGSAMVMMRKMPKGVVAKAFAVTVEPEGGTDTPTLPMVMVGESGG
jgi:anti-sigma-K factor RskA